jgi:hypothetical protein
LTREPELSPSTDTPTQRASPSRGPFISAEADRALEADVHRITSWPFSRTM